MTSVKDIIKLIDSPTEKDIELITKAYNFAEKAHQGHIRYSGEPYFNHLTATAQGLAEIGMGPITIAVGLLHDSIEDVGVLPETIKVEFGEEILFLVDGVTKLGTLKYRGVKRHTESLRKFLVATSQDIRVVIIKLLDRLHNIKTLEYVPQQKRKRIALETLEIYAPIADRLGMGRIKRELEDYAFPHIYPKESKEIHELLKERHSENKENLEKVLKTIKKELGSAGITKFRTEMRIKGDYSLFTKLERKNSDISKIYDISALRIIVPTIEDCYRVLGVIHGMWRPLPGKIKDYIAFHKPNGYRSIHTTVFTGQTGPAEIQIRTEQMHKEAEFGIASHLSYKDEQRGEEKGTSFLWFKQFFPLVNKVLGKQPQHQEEKILSESVPLWIKQMAEAQQETKAKPEEYLDEMKTDFFSYRVFAFTPKGDVIDLPLDSSAIDFAYAVHSDVGNHVAGAKVNGKMVSLDTKLKNGDVVEILTKEKSKPTRKWLEFAKTTLAKRHIRNATQKD